ncbi:metallophosphoesterase [Methylobacterium sp.]|uniref:metallophosphoesterase n=1 Tax=Methylobacterium sp. TaxID=409 RepID=UPI003B02A233
MKIWIFSDTHRDISRRPWTPVAIPDADVAVVAGDIGHGLADSVSWLASAIRPFMPVVFVPGNHEFYGGIVSEERELGRRAAELQDIVLLDDRTVTLGGCTFSGATLWTDYALYGRHMQAEAMRVALALMNDHRMIAAATRPTWRRFRPQEALDLHQASRAFLSDALLIADPPEGRTRQHVVVTHHAPAPGSITTAFAGNRLNPAFVSDMADLIDEARPALWIHGHMHSRIDYRIGATRIVANPLGYDDENFAFDPGLVIETGS